MDRRVFIFALCIFTVNGAKRSKRGLKKSLFNNFWFLWNFNNPGLLKYLEILTRENSQNWMI